MALGGLKKLLIRIGADTTALDKDLARAAKAITRTGRKMEMAGQRLTLGITAPLALIGGVAVRESIRFEDAMAGVAKTTDATSEELAILGEQFKELSHEIPVTAVALGDIGAAAGQLGIATENIASFSKVMADLGVATNITAEEAAIDLARFSNIMRIPQANVDRLGSAIVDLGNNFATSEREIVNMSLRLAGAGSVVGLTAAEVLGLATGLSQVGVEAEVGGTAFSRIMADIQDAVQSGSDKLQNFAAVAGVSSAEFAKNWKEDTAGTLVEFITGLARIEEEGGNVFEALRAVMFQNIRLRDSLLRASRASEQMKDALSTANTAWEENNALIIEAEKFYRTTGNQLLALLNRAKTAAIEIGDRLSPAILMLGRTLEPVIDFVTKLARGFGELPELLQVIVIGMAALTATIGPALTVLGIMVQSIGFLVAAAGAVGLTAVFVTGGVLLVGMAAFAALLWEMDRAANASNDAARELNRQLVELADTVGRMSKQDLIIKFAENDVALETARGELARLGAVRRDLRTGRFGPVSDLDETDEARFQELGPMVENLRRKGRILQAAFNRMLAGDFLKPKRATGIFNAEGSIGKGPRTVVDVLNDMNAAMLKGNLLTEDSRRRFDSLAFSIQTLEKAYDELVELGMDPAGMEAQQLMTTYDRLRIQQDKMRDAAREGNDEIERQTRAINELRAAMQKLSNIASLLGQFGIPGLGFLSRAVGFLGPLVRLLGPKSSLVPAVAGGGVGAGLPSGLGSMNFNLIIEQDGIQVSRVQKRILRNDALGVSHRLTLPPPPVKP